MLVGYGLGERIELVARGTYYKSEGTPLQVGTFDEKDLFAFFEPYGDYEEVGFEVGLRYYISAAGRLKSYVAPVVGGARPVRGPRLVLHPRRRIPIQNVPFHEESTVPVFGLDLGFTYDLGERLFVGLDTGLRYQGAPSSLEGLEGLAGINDADGRWTAPVVATIGVRF